jgi:SAM-dependent methyltransferase
LHPPDGTNDAQRRPTLLERLHRGRVTQRPPTTSTPQPNGAEEQPEREPGTAALAADTVGAPAFDPARFRRGIEPGRFAVETDSVSAALYERLDERGIADLRRRIEADPTLAATFENARDPTIERYLLLHYGAWLGDGELFAHTGLRPAQPPAEIHAMAHGPMAAAGGLYEADMVAAALESAGVEIASLHSALDFGCSSGRVVRVLAAAYPDVRWFGCDPNADAIAWAKTELPGIAWFHSGNEPPLPLADEQLDMAYAISIWSHFEPLFGLRWFAEMWRVLRPGGHLVFTAHGPTTLAYDARDALRPPAECIEIERALYRDGRWFIDCFGPSGDWGVVNPSWGSAFVTPEFVLEQLCPRWSVVEFVPGRNQERQDVYVLARA